jgi:predicted ATPase
MPQAIVSALGVRERAGEPLIVTLTRALAKRECLLVLDNCEHVIEVCARLIGELLDHCQLLRVLATSGEALRIPGEQTWRVPSLALPDQSAGPRVIWVRSAWRRRLPTPSTTPPENASTTCRSHPDRVMRHST